jgi:hypothetical protein
MLAIPDIRQRCGHDCGPSVFRAVAGFLGLPDGDVPGSHELTGLSPDYLETSLRRAGCRCVSGDMDIADLGWHTAKGRPVIALITPHRVGHYVIVRGVGSRNAVHVHDPLTGQGKYGQREWLRIWRDVHRLGSEYCQFGIAVWT